MASHRKRHNKSRAGCLTCKSRRVKCDEGRPSCQNCLRGHRDCSYTHGASPTSTSSPVTAASNGNTRPTAGYNQERLQPFLPSTRSLSSQPFPGISRSQELYLMHHYATVTWSTLADTDSPEETDLWKNAIPREGLKYEFLMNALLAASSLHLAHLEPPRKQFYTTVSLEYQSHGLNSFKTALDHIDGENVNALFAFSVIVTILAFRPDMHDSAPVDTLQSIFELLRGVGVISKTAEVNIQTGMFKSLLTPHGGPRPGCEITSSDEVENGMARLRGRADHIAKYVGPAHHEVYISCISSLQICFEHISTHQSIGTAIAWPVLISDKLIALFQQKDPMAQLIWIHYGVLLLYIHNRWWGRGFGVRLIESLSDSLHSLDEEWATFTQWPRKRARIVSQKAETSC